MNEAKTLACVFDAYGTLFDVHAAIARHRAAAGARSGPVFGNLADQTARIHLDAHACRPLRRFLEPDRARAGLFIRARAVGRPRAAAKAARSLSRARRISRRANRAHRAQGAWPAHRHSFQRIASHAHRRGRGVRHRRPFDAVLSVDAVRMYKPRPEVYALVTDGLGIKREEVVFVSSNRWDVMGAAAFGFRPLWVNRARMPDEYAGARRRHRPCPISPL